MDNPTVSVILPVYNGEEFLDKAIDSVLGQEYGDYEFLICDDGSTDSTREIISSRNDPRIVLHGNNKKEGLFPTLNRIIKSARGKYIRLWSCDDIMEPGCLKEEVEFFTLHPQIGFSYCGRNIINEKGKIISAFLHDTTPDVIPSRLAAQIMFYHGSLPGNIATVMIRKEVLTKIGYFREDMKQSGDLEMWVRISNKYPIGFIRKQLIKLRKHKGQFSLEKGAGLLGIQENREIFLSLMKRLPHRMVPYAKKYARWHRHVQYLHYTVRCMLRGDLETARKVVDEIKKVDNPLILTLLWLVTVNGRYFRVLPRYFIEEEKGDFSEKTG